MDVNHCPTDLQSMVSFEGALVPARTIRLCQIPGDSVHVRHQSIDPFTSTAFGHAWMNRVLALELIASFLSFIWSVDQRLSSVVRVRVHEMGSS